MAINLPSPWRWPRRILMGLVGLLFALTAGLWMFLRGSLPQLEGEVTVAGLAAPVRVTRDAQGVPVLEGKDRLDLAYATGYLHAQDRFFQMDLLRRVAAGELSGLVGAAALDTDRGHRFHRFRARAESVLKTLAPAELAVLERYASGVNAGLAALSSRPFEYGLLMTAPEPWRPADTLLVVWAMYFDLQGNLERRELARGWLKEHATPEQLAVLLPDATRFDAPLDAAEVSATGAPTAVPAQAPEWFGKAGDTKLAALEFRTSVGSNNWAVAGSRTRHGSAIVADDMHLGIRLPHIWYRAVLQYPDAAGKQRRVAGVTLPGAPFVVVGSNGRVAWGFTNSYGDYLDLIELERDKSNPLRFKTGADWETAVETVELLGVKGGEAVPFKVLETSLGPVREVGGRFYAVRWIAHQPGAVNINLGKLEDADDLVAAQAIANTAGMPAQNMVAGDSAGRVGWTIAGPLPGRSAQAAASFPFTVDAPLGWQGQMAPADYPRVLDPQDGQVWTANSRQLAGAEYAKLGDGGADLGARARQIRDNLTALGTTDEKGVYGVGLDDRALFIGEWRDRALKLLDDTAVAGKPERAEFRRLLNESWDGRASVSSVGYRLSRQYMYGLYAELFGGVDAELGKLMEKADFDSANPRWPVVVARLLDEQPAGWLPAGRDWKAVQLAAVDRAITELTENGAQLSSATWGARNTSRFIHPLVRAVPALQPWLSTPAVPQAGDENMPRVSGPDFGQSERMSVSPGKEEQGIFNMPGGQSGHPLSSYFLAGHEAWVKGEPTPFLPGPAVHTLTFKPL
ncbi:MAG: penicillin acylase family protein [Myxococcaceae bacterium]|nr:penicillin acylase family protein [Myxococcaceae bacterium]